jgi:4-amino-4-deoxy-L-arabinose transferase-like glycosyltransferase
MPIYPYMTALMVTIVGTENKYITAMAIKFPLVIADFILCLFIYKVGHQLNYKKEGLFTSLFYAINPISIAEITLARWDVVVSLTIFICLYFLLENRPFALGATISLGFLTKEVPLFFFGSVLIYWIRDWKKIIQTGLSFLVTLVGILLLVLVPFGTTLKQMIDGLTSHPIYAEEANSCGDACHAPSQDIMNFFGLFIDLPETTYVIIWAVIFGIFTLLPMYLFVKNEGNEEKLFSVILIQITLLSIFFWSMHSQFLLWSLPWTIFFVIKEGRYYSIPPIIVVSYILRKITFNAITVGILDFPADIALIIVGSIMIYESLKDLGFRDNDLRRVQN